MICVRRALRGLLAAALLWLAGSGAWAQSPQQVPTLTARVIDQTGTLTAEQRQALVDKLAAFETRKGSQIAVLIVPTTQPEDIAAYANRVANAWKIGRKGVGDGVLLVVAKNDRKLRIEVAKTLEGAITDLQARRVIEQDIAPRFKQGDFAGGISKGVDALIRLVDGEALPAPGGASSALPPDQLSDVLEMWMWLYGLIGALTIGAAGLRHGLKITGMFAASSAALGLPTWLLTHDSGSTSAAAAIGIPLSLVIYGGLQGGRVSRSTGSAERSWADVDRATGAGSWSSSGSSGSSDSFSSGGGGDFGGGGASGDW